MSAAAPQMDRIGRLRQRWRFHLSALVLILPLAFMPSYFEMQRAMRSASESGLRSTDIAVGPWTMQFQELERMAPFETPDEGIVKPFALSPCPRCVADVRAAFVRLGKPHSVETYGTLFTGNPHRQFADVPIPPGTSPEDELWLTLEGWDGSVHQASLPIRTASPVTASWLEKARRP